MKSTHEALVVPVKLENHPDADLLSVVKVDGYTVVVRTEDFKDRDLGVYIPPDNLVDITRPEFAFLADPKRPNKKQKLIAARKIRNVPSYGLLIPAPEDSKQGENLADYYGVVHYEPEDELDPIIIEKYTGTKPRELSCISKYDIDSLAKYTHWFEDGEEVVVNEKIHGANARFIFIDDQLWCGTRTRWFPYGAESESDWCMAVNNVPQIREFCETNPRLMLYGEVYGKNKNMKYGRAGKIDFAAFDIFNVDAQCWDDWNNFIMTCQAFNIPTCPHVGIFHFSLNKAKELADGPSLVDGANHHREGVVIRPLCERRTHKGQRVILKMVGMEYLSKPH